MNCTRFTVDHICLTTSKPFVEVRSDFERQLGRMDAEQFRKLVDCRDARQAQAGIEAMAGPSGFMIFAVQDHGSLLGVLGAARQALQYVVGNPWYALQMTQYDIRASLYAPLRALLYETDTGQTCLEYDRPSSFFGQFGNQQVAKFAELLDQKLGELAAVAMR
jgi:uncharacterized protein (DUF302 family)